MSRAAAARIEFGSDRPSAIVETKAGSASFSRADSTTGDAHADSAAKMSDIEEPKRGSARQTSQFCPEGSPSSRPTFGLLEPRLQDNSDKR